MTEAIKINSDFAKKFLCIGIVILVLTSGLFILKSITGYEKVTFVDNYDNCSVSVRTETHRYRSRKRRRTRRSYHVTVTNREHNIDFHSQCSKSYYKGFLKYANKDDVKLSFFKTEDNVIFPVYRLGCDEKEAEHEWRGANPPIAWYMLYGLGICVSVIMFSIGFKANKTSANYVGTPAASAPSKENQDLTAEFDRLMAQDKYGKYRNH